MFLLKFPRSSDKTAIGRKTLVHNFSGRSGYAESYRTLRTNLSFSLDNKELQSITVTSALQGEGKTNTAANLAYTISQTGKSVIMVDADLRKPGLTARFSTVKNRGLSTLISEALGKHLTRGKIADYGLKDLITLCSLQRRTCIMSIVDDANEVELYFRKGELVDLYWKNRPDSKRLANTLVRDKILTDEQANIALGHQQKSLRRLGGILLSLGLVKEEELLKILFSHTMEAFRVVISMKGGIFLFRPVAEDEFKFSLQNKCDFESLYSEFFGDETAKSYINEAVKKVIIPTKHDNLFLLPSGKIPPNPSELLSSAKTAFLFKYLKQKFDVLIIDSSPIMPASDALLLAPHTDGVVLVVQSGRANKKITQDAVQQLHNAQANILGVTLNLVDRTQDGNYKYYQGYYGNE